MALWLTIFIGLSQLLLGGLGVYVSLRPPKKEHHWFWIGCFGLIGLLGIVLTGVLAKAGDKAQAQANRDIHAAQTAASDANIAATKANVAATNAATAATNAETAATSAQHETERARGEAHKASTDTQSLITQKSTETDKTIQNWRTDTESAVSKILRPGRTLGDQRSQLVNELKSYGPHEIAITPAHGSEEAIAFSNEIEAAFKDAGWTIVPTQKLALIVKDGLGLRIVMKLPEAGKADSQDSDLTPTQIAVARAFKDIGMQLNASPITGGDSGVTELYVGLQ